MIINYEKQRALGYAGLALLRNWLIGNTSSITSIFKEISFISKTEQDFENSGNQKAIEHSLIDGYKIWSHTYDTEQNILLQIEEPVMKSILKKMTSGSSLDAACGTGRYSSFLHSLGHQVTGMDVSGDMLALAKKKNKHIHFVHGDLTSLPFGNDTFSLVVCGLAIHYVTNIEEVIKEFTRVVCPGGHIVISTVHPWLIALGAHAEFHDNKGGWGFIKENIFWHSAYINAFNKTSLKILDCQEPTIGIKQISVLQKGSKLSPSTMYEALNGLPAATIWVLEKSKNNESKNNS